MTVFKSLIFVQKLANNMMASHGGVDVDRLHELLSELPTVEQLRNSRVTIQPMEFEKDDDTNYHMDYIVASSNLRAFNYGIPPADKHKVRNVNFCFCIEVLSNPRPK